MQKSLVAQAEQLLQQTLESSAAPNAIVELVWAGPKRMAALNKRYRSVNEPTDVLSFPLYTYEELRSKNQESGKIHDTQYPIRNTPPALLGTLVLCQSEILRRAQTSDQTPAAYLEWAIAHGVKHLLGYDHDESGERWHPV